MAEKKNILKKKKLKQIILNFFCFSFLKYVLYFVLFTKVVNLKTFHDYSLNFWKHPWVIKYKICLTPVICVLSIEHGRFFLAPELNPNFPRTSEQKKMQTKTLLSQKKTIMYAAKFWKGCILKHLQLGLSNFYLSFCT